MRRTLIIIAIVVVVAGIGAAVYFFFFAGSAGVAVAPAGSTGLPSAGNSATGTSGGSLAAGTVPNSPTKVTARLVKIDAGPVVLGEAAVDVNVLLDGALATTTRAGSSTPDVSVEYIERQSGNIFSYLVNAGTLTRTSNKTLPGIQNAAWLPDGSNVFVQYLSGTDSSTINTYSLPANGQGGFFLPQNLSEISVGTNSILTLASGVNGSLGMVERPDGSKSVQAFSTPLSMVRAGFAGKDYLVYTKPSATLDGYAYLVDPSGNFSRIAGPLPGLVALASPLGTWVLVSWSESGVMSMELVNTKTRAVTALPVATIADKCIWSADESAIYCGIPIDPSANYAYPDDWYQGAVSFNDNIWKIDVAGRLAELELDFSSATDVELDAEALTIDPESKTLVFVNKNDGSLWSYQL